MSLLILTGLLSVFTTVVAVDYWVDGDPTNFTEEQALLLLDKHNEYRSYEYADAMRKLVYDETIAASAQWAADRCTYTHTGWQDRYDPNGYGVYGENIYVTTASQTTGFMTSIPVDSWWEEIDFYDFYGDVCQDGKECGHYLAVVWDTTKAVGCGVKYCDAIQGWDDRSGYIVFCQYGPNGIYDREEQALRPYYEGDSCSNCPSDAPVCDDYYFMCTPGEATTPAPTTTTTLAPTEPTTAAPLSCAEGWTEIEGKCYQYMPTQKRYRQAVSECEQLNATLAMPKTDAIYRGLRQIAGTSVRLVWMGLNDLDKDDVFTWIDGTAVTTTNWDNRQPSGESCVVMFKTGTWRTIGCSRRRSYFCEIAMQ